MSIWNFLHTAIWYILWPFGIVCGHLVYYVFPFWYVWTKEKYSNLNKTGGFFSFFMVTGCIAHVLIRQV
jgi:hypothetical protein